MKFSRRSFAEEKRKQNIFLLLWKTRVIEEEKKNRIRKIGEEKIFLGEKKKRLQKNLSHINLRRHQSHQPERSDGNQILT